MDEDTGNFLFGLLTMLLCLAVLAMLLGILIVLHAGIVFFAYVSCWLLVVGIARAVIAPKTAVMVSVAMGTIGVTSFLLYFFLQIFPGMTAHEGLFMVLTTWPFGLFLGLIVAVIVELAFRGLD